MHVANTSYTSTCICTTGLLYTYLAEGIGRNDSGAFRALKCGFNYWALGRIDHLFVQYAHPTYCHVKCDMIPSMKTGTYRVYILLVKSGDLAKRIEKATCDCAAGYVRVAYVIFYSNICDISGYLHHAYTYLAYYMP